MAIYVHYQARIPNGQGLFPLHIAAMVGRPLHFDELVKKCPEYYELVDDKEEIFFPSRRWPGAPALQLSVAFLCRPSARTVAGEAEAQAT